MPKDMKQTQVLIVGAGPTGLVLALWLARRGVAVRIVDKAAKAGTTSRALGVQARTLEFYRQMGLADRVIESGREVSAVNLTCVPFGRSGKRMESAVLTWNEPLTSSFAFGPNSTPAGLIKNRFAPPMVVIVPKIFDGRRPVTSPVTRPRMLVIPDVLKVAVSVAPTLN